MADNSAIVVISWLDPCIKKNPRNAINPFTINPMYTRGTRYATEAQDSCWQKNK